MSSPTEVKFDDADAAAISMAIIANSSLTSRNLRSNGASLLSQCYEGVNGVN